MVNLGVGRHVPAEICTSFQNHCNPKITNVWSDQSKSDHELVKKKFEMRVNAASLETLI